MIKAKNIQVGLVAGAVVVGGLLLITGTASLGVLLLIGLFVLCPLMMLGMHGGGDQHGDAAKPTQASGDESQAAARPHVH